MPPHDSYLQRYLAGEYEQVWADLLALGPAVRDEPVYSDALAVARETMRRVRHNIELLIDRLESLGYQFGYHWLADAPGRQFSDEEIVELEGECPHYRPPLPDAAERLEELVERVGPLPVSLYAWYQVVGTVDFVGEAPPNWDNLGYLGFQGAAYKRFIEEHPRPTSAEFRQFEKEHLEFSDAVADEAIYLDPLVIQPIEHTLQLAEASHDGSEHYRVPLAPDSNHKCFVSGGGPYEITAPCLAVDAPFDGEWHDTTFVNYLRICFRWGGFPGLDRAPRPRRPTSPTSPTTSCQSESALPMPPIAYILYSGKIGNTARQPMSAARGKNGKTCRVSPPIPLHHDCSSASFWRTPVRPPLAATRESGKIDNTVPLFVRQFPAISATSRAPASSIYLPSGHFSHSSCLPSAAVRVPADLNRRPVIPADLSGSSPPEALPRAGLPAALQAAARANEPCPAAAVLPSHSGHSGHVARPRSIIASKFRPLRPFRSRASAASLHNSGHFGHHIPCCVINYHDFRPFWPFPSPPRQLRAHIPAKSAISLACHKPRQLRHPLSHPSP